MPSRRKHDFSQRGSSGPRVWFSSPANCRQRGLIFALEPGRQPPGIIEKRNVQLSYTCLRALSVLSAVQVQVLVTCTNLSYKKKHYTDLQVSLDVASIGATYFIKESTDFELFRKTRHAAMFSSVRGVLFICGKYMACIQTSKLPCL